MFANTVCYFPLLSMQILLFDIVLDFCFANILCGEHGRCVNTLTGFKCTCSFLYGGLVCDKSMSSDFCHTSYSN